MSALSHEYAMLRLQERNPALLFELAPHQLRCFPPTGFADAFRPLGLFRKAQRPLTSRIDLPVLLLPAEGQKVTDLREQIPACDWLQSRDETPTARCFIQLQSLGRSF